jgi:hypothetical protein
MIVKNNIIIKLACTIFYGVMSAMIIIGVVQLRDDKYHSWKDLASAWWIPVLCNAFFLFSTLIEYVFMSRGENLFKLWEELISPYDKIELDSCGISRIGLRRDGGTNYRWFKSWEELTLSPGKWNDGCGFVFCCPNEPPEAEGKWIFFRVNFFLAKPKQLMEFAVNKLPVENISDEAVLKLKKMGVLKW